MQGMARWIGMQLGSCHMYDGVFDLHGKSVMTSVVDSSISHNRRDRSWGLIIARVGNEQHGKFNSNAEYLSFLG